MNVLEEIIAYKKIEVDKSKDKLPLDKLKKLIKQQDLKRHNFLETIKNKVNKNQIALIGEIKKASPSKGIIRKNFNPLEIAKSYKAGGALCLSVLTDEKYFQGSLKYIQEIKNVIDLPILRKDFIIDSYQIYESIHNNADCVLLIVGAFHGMPSYGKDTIKMLFDISIENELDSLIEIHNEREMEIALNINPQMIGINNRDLKTFETNIETTKQLVSKYKRDLKDKIIVSESGIVINHDIKSLMEHNVYAFLVGEGLLKEKNIEEATRKLIGVL